MRLTSSNIVTRILSCPLLLAFIVISWNTNSAQGHVLRTAERFIADIEGRENAIASLSNTQKEPEIGHVKFVTRLQHETDLSKSDYHIIEVYRPSKNSTTVIHLHRKTTIVAENFKIVVKNGDDEEPEILSGEDVESDCLYHGTIPSEPDSQVALSACGGHFGFSGLVISNDGHWMMEPHLAEMKTSKSTLEVPHVITIPEPEKAVENCGSSSDKLRLPLEEVQKEMEARKSQNESKNEETNEVSSDNGQSMQNTMIDGGNSEKQTFVGTSGQTVTFATKTKTKTKGSSKPKKGSSGSSAKKAVDIAVFTDANFYSRMKSIFPKDTVNEIKNYVMTIIFGMHLLYDQKSLGTTVAIRLVHLEIQQQWPSALSSEHNGNGGKYIKAFCKYAGKLNTHHWDHSLMLTGMDLTDDDGKSDVAGLAYMDAMCYRHSSCSVSEGTNLGVIHVISHEIGHSLGMDHDGEGPSKTCDANKHLMSPSTGPGKLTWSTCSAQNLKDFLQYGTASGKGPYPTPTCLTSLSDSKAIDFTSPSLPGQKYDANVQCTLFCGSSYSPYIPKSGSGSNICDMLLCSNKKMVSSSHPALEGTPCGKGKYCRAGKCATKK